MKRDNGLTDTHQTQEHIKNRMASLIKNGVYERLRGNKFNLGRKHSEESKEKMRSAALKTRASLSKSVIRKTLKNLDQTGRKHSEETKRKMSESHRGEKSPHWKGGLTKLYALIRRCFKYRQWRSDVFSRDNFICVLCGYSKGGILEADHIIRLADLVQIHNIKTLEDALVCEPLWDINNGRTLCHPCHRTTETYGANYKSKILGRTNNGT